MPPPPALVWTCDTGTLSPPQMPLPSEPQAKGPGVAGRGSSLLLAPRIKKMRGEPRPRAHFLQHVSSAPAQPFVRSRLLPFRQLPAPHLPAQRPSRKRRTRHQTGASASGCPPSGHCNTWHTGTVGPPPGPSRPPVARAGATALVSESSGTGVTGTQVRMPVVSAAWSRPFPGPGSSF